MSRYSNIAIYACLLGCVLSCATSRAADVETSIKQRLDEDPTSATPDFQKHVVPLLGRLGCNGRACHGSFQGRGGFRLSLFGYDFKMDHAALTAKSSSADQLRVNRKEPDQSLVILKPTLEVEHEGGDLRHGDAF